MNTLLERNAKAIEKAREEMEKEITNKIMAVFLVIGKEWQAAHPKRHLKLVAGMGAAFWTVDDKILHLDHEKQKQFTTLCQAFDWLDSVLENHEYLDRYLSDIDFKNI